MSEWLVSFVFAETLLLTSVLFSVGVIRLLARQQSRQFVGVTIAATVYMIAFGVQKLTYVNTGTALCMTQEFVIDQMAVISLGFWLRAWRCADLPHRMIPAVGSMFCIACIAMVIVLTAFPNAPVVYAFEVWRGDLPWNR